MAGELSPDRLFYWDGGRWVSALSPDGAWRWDGAAWRAAGRPGGVTRPSRMGSRMLWLIAATTIAILLVAGAGTYFAWGFMRSAAQRFLQSTSVATCNSKLSQPGAVLAPGDSLCGGKLGFQLILADCTSSAGAPDGIDVWQKNYSPTEGDWLKSTVTTGPAGCNLAASPNTDVSFDTSNEEPAQAVVIADFTVSDRIGGIGIQLACSQEAGCVDIAIYSDGYYSLAEGRPNGGWDDMTKGYVSFGGPIRTGRANRLIVRLTGHEAEVWVNGVELTHGTTKRDQAVGYVDFYLDNRDSKVLESVWLQRLYVFDSFSG